MLSSSGFYKTCNETESAPVIFECLGTKRATILLLKKDKRLFPVW